MMASNVYKMDYISLLYFRVKFTKWTTLSQIFFELNSADADGGPRSHVRTAGHSAQPPINVSGNFSAHVSAE